MSAYARVDLPEPFGPMTAWTSFVFTARSTPLTISVPSSSATCRFFSSRSATLEQPFRRKERGSPRRSCSYRTQDQCRSGCRQTEQRGFSAVDPEPRPDGRLARLIVEPAVGAGIARQRLRGGVRGGLRLRLLRVLTLPAVPEQDEIAGARRDFLAPEQLLRAPAERQLAHRPFAAPDRRLREWLRLVDRRHRLGLKAHLLACAVELRRVDC